MTSIHTMNIFNQLRVVDMKQDGFIYPTYYVASNVFNNQSDFFYSLKVDKTKFFDSNHLMRPEPEYLVLKIVSKSKCK